MKGAVAEAAASAIFASIIKLSGVFPMRSAALAATGLFVILASAAAAQGTGGGSDPATQSTQPKGPDQLICRRVQESGSLARRPRRCYTRAQWDRLAEDSRGTASTANTGGTSGN